MISATRFSARTAEPEMTSISPPPNSIAAMDPRRFIICPCNPPAVLPPKQFDGPSFDGPSFELPSSDVLRSSRESARFRNTRFRNTQFSDPSDPEENTKMNPRHPINPYTDWQSCAGLYFGRGLHSFGSAVDQACRRRVLHPNANPTACQKSSRAARCATRGDALPSSAPAPGLPG